MVDKRDERIERLQRLLAERTEELRICKEIIKVKEEIIGLSNRNRSLLRENYETLKIEYAILTGKKKPQQKPPHTTMTVLKSDV